MRLFRRASDSLTGAQSLSKVQGHPVFPLGCGGPLPARHWLTRPASQKPVAQWQQKQIGRWLASLGLQDYEAAFKGMTGQARSQEHA